MGEFDLITALARRFAVPRQPDVEVGIGDDAAVVAFGRGKRLVATVDTLTAGTHFPIGTAPAAIGHKALAVNLSDLAAMGATPRFALLALTLPSDDRTFALGIARGIDALARRHAVAVVGGDTTRGALALTITALGEIAPRRALTRASAAVGDRVYVSGTLGDAGAGLWLGGGDALADAARAVKASSKIKGTLIARARRAGKNPIVADASATTDPQAAGAKLTRSDHATLRARLDRPTPRVVLGRSLVGFASACVDVSDGLAQDLGHVLDASGVGATIDVDALPRSRAFTRLPVSEYQKRAWQLCAGDDYELAFTVPPARARRIAALSAELGLALTAIGVITAGRGLSLVDAAGQRVALSPAGWNHFR